MIIEKIHIILRYVLGRKFNKKIVVFESDDWGSMRINSKRTFDKLKKSGIPIHNDPYSKYDTIETSDDLKELYEILIKYKDKKGNPPCITTNTLTANPDFCKIKDKYFSEYFFITLKESYEKYSEGQKVIDLIKDGINCKLIYPQFHGREHLNVPLWLRGLKNGDKNLLSAFEHNVFAVPSSSKINSKSNPTSAFDSTVEEDLIFFESSIKDGINLFNDFFNFHPKTMIAPSYTWSDVIEETASLCGIKGFQGILYQNIPKSDGMLKKKFHYTGQKNKFGQYYLVRNAFFEPCVLPGKDWVNDCLKRINIAFKFNNPAIIGTHRVNFIGAIEEKNRTRNLKLFNELLKKIVTKWPNAEFLNSSELIKLFEKSH